MTDFARPPLQIRCIDSIDAVSGAAWDGVTGTAYPFLRHAFLQALESTGCANAGSGWQARHLLLEDAVGTLMGCLPMYLKEHSYGEYVFDWAWADAYRRHGLAYYPKLLSAVPFTPCAGPRLALAPGVEAATVLPLYLDYIQELALSAGASSWHLLFPQEQDLPALQHAELMQRSGCQYQWFNRGYTDFDAFLATLSSRKRKNLRKERMRVAEAGIQFRLLPGTEITPELWARFHRFYANTYLVRGRRPYLNLEFFLALGERMPEALLLILAEHEGQPVAGALCFVGDDTLYGRYWGCDEEHQFLHFETCYYQGIDYCIARGLQRFDSGAQGEHKIQRGFEPVPTWSLHWVAHPAFRAAIAEFVEDEARHVEHYLQQAAGYLPFRKDLQA